MTARAACASFTGMEAAAVVTSFLDMVQRGDASAFALVAENFVQHAAGPQGRDGLRQTAAVLNHDLDNPRGEVHHVIADGDLVVVHLSLHGRHAASTMPLLSGAPVTGKPVSWRFIHIFRVHEGHIAEHWACRDDVDLLVQVDAWPR
ncbi:MAG: ester cyclase [Mycobacteriales bacterium]